MSSRPELESTLRSRRDQGRKLLVPYITGGLGDWTDLVLAAAAAGADAIEVGIPFSDPVMDGPTIQEASMRALAAGATPVGIASALGRLDVDVPLVVMLYYNLVFRSGHRRFARTIADAGVAGAIVPDLPVDEIGDWARAADDAGVATVLLAAPTTPEERLSRICDRSRGFVYGVGLMGVTGERRSLSAAAAVMAKRLKAATDKPVLIGIGVSTAEQAREVTEVADGVVVGSAIMRRVLEGGGPDEVGAFVSELRAGLDRERAASA